MTGTNGPRDPGDIGRRVAHRRADLGLDVAEVAARAEMAPGYVEYLESQPADVPYQTVVRLAVALETTAAELLGAGVDLAPGQAHHRRPAARLEKLSRAECRNLLGRGGIGRIVFYDPRGPVALPVNYRMAGDDIVFRTAALSSLRGARYAERVSFEVDHIDEAMRQGWSVLVTGSAREVDDTDELLELEGLGVEPWAGEERPVYLRIEPKTVSGRRIRVPSGSA
jgi:nitroimidazol reductase NimA-like FMN-containing flavoprotein (pyridoxamine 5'-phosphate oxidase superfamily)